VPIRVQTRISYKSSISSPTTAGFRIPEKPPKKRSTDSILYANLALCNKYRQCRPSFSQCSLLKAFAIGITSWKSKWLQKCPLSMAQQKAAGIRIRILNTTNLTCRLQATHSSRCLPRPCHAIPCLQSSIPRFHTLRLRRSYRPTTCHKRNTQRPYLRYKRALSQTNHLRNHTIAPRRTSPRSLHHQNSNKGTQQHPASAVQNRVKSHTIPLEDSATLGESEDLRLQKSELREPYTLKRTARLQASVGANKRENRKLSWKRHATTSEGTEC
jgi:hypothetical protein